MIPVTQDKFGKQEGNCLMACAASILEKPLRDCPDLAAGVDEQWWEKISAFLRENCYYAIYLSTSLLKDAVPAGYSIATGPAARGLLHCCVALDGAVVHDPHPDRSGLLSIEYYLAFVPIIRGTK